MNGNKRELIITQRERHLRKVITTATKAAEARLRDAIQGEALVEQICEAIHVLGSGVEMRDLFNTGQLDRVFLTNDRATQVRASADLACKLLGKVLPDLKSVEMTADGAGVGITILTYVPRTPLEEIILDANAEASAGEALPDSSAESSASDAVVIESDARHTGDPQPQEISFI